jgi:hypothetical protein
MTSITHAAILAAVETIPEHAYPSEAADHIARALGVEVPVSEPPAEMVKLAREIAASYVVRDGEHSDTWVAVAALQHAVAKCHHVAQACSGHGQHDLAQTAIDCAEAIAGGRDAG